MHLFLIHSFLFRSHHVSKDFITLRLTRFHIPFSIYIHYNHVLTFLLHLYADSGHSGHYGAITKPNRV